MNTQLLKARQTKYAAYAIVYILVVVAIVVVANVLADRYNKTYDGTANKRYSLSDQTAKIAKGLKQDATITYFNQSTRFQQGKDLLDQYTNLSPKVQRPHPGYEPNRPARRSGSSGGSCFQLRFAPHREPDERHGNRVSAFTITGDQERRQDDR